MPAVFPRPEEFERSCAGTVGIQVEGRIALKFLRLERSPEISVKGVVSADCYDVDHAASSAATTFVPELQDAAEAFNRDFAAPVLDWTQL